MRRFSFGFLPLLGLLAGLLAAEGAGPTAAVRPAASLRRVNCEGTNVVCPVFYWGFFGGYHHYMGQLCADKTTVGLASSVPLELCQCANACCTDKCLPIGSFAAKEPGAKEKPTADKSPDDKPATDKPAAPRKATTANARLLPGQCLHYFRDGLEGGIPDANQAPRDDRDVIQTGAGFTATPVKPRLIAQLYLDQAGTRPIKVALHTIKVVPDNQVRFDTTIFGSGFQVNSGDVEAIIPWNKIKGRNGRCLLVKHDGYDYLVVIGSSTAPPEDAK